ncbi:hypothetical protein ACHAXR_002829 [Thalassiosira sp. AJA248-18]
MKLKMEKSNKENKDPCEVKWIECPLCRMKTCFNTEDPVVDLGRCDALRMFRAMHHVMPPGTGEGASIGSESRPASSADDEQAMLDKPRVQHECNDDSDEESRFSYVSNPEIDTEDMDKTGSNTALVPQTCLITRMQIHCLTGGIRGGYKNPLNVATPMGFCGGRALATLDGKIHHICVKEDMNHPLPKFLDEEFLLYRRTKTRGPLLRDIQLLVDLQLNHPPIPIFWEPTDQEDTKVRYVGHWKVTNVDDFSSNPIVYMDYLRCALVKLKFVQFNQRWAHIIHLCRDKSNRSINWGDIEDYGDSHYEETDRQVSNHHLGKQVAGSKAINDSQHDYQHKEPVPNGAGNNSCVHTDMSNIDANTMVSASRRPKEV